jgi:hypothetical protein
MVSRRCFKWAAILCSIPDWVDFTGSVSDRRHLSIIVDAASQAHEHGQPGWCPRLKLGFMIRRLPDHSAGLKVIEQLTIGDFRAARPRRGQMHSRADPMGSRVSPL